jgi:hypothetical protein
MCQLKARQNLHMNVAIAYRENVVLSNVNNLLFATRHYNCLETKMRQLKARQNLHMNVAIAYGEKAMLSNVNTLLFAMTRYNCLETKMRQPRDDGIVEKWTQYVDQRTISKVEQPPTIFSVFRESSCNTTSAGSSFNQQREQCRQIWKLDSHVQFSVGIHFARCQS